MNIRKQLGQGMTEYIVILSALAFVFLHEVEIGDPDYPMPEVPDWESDGYSNRYLECPNGESSCTIVEILTQVLRNRNDGYTYAISSTFYPERILDLDDLDLENLLSTETPSTGVGGDPDESTGSYDEDTEDDEVPGGDVDVTDTDVDVAISSDGSGAVLGEVGDDDCITNDEGELTGILSADGSLVYEAVASGSSCEAVEDADGNKTIIGEVGDLQSDGTVLDSSGDVLGSI